MGKGPYLIRVSMTEVEPVLDFASSGRTGRRNALPDILGSPAGVSPSDLPLKLAEMSLSAGGCWVTHGGGTWGWHMGVAVWPLTAFLAPQAAPRRCSHLLQKFLHRSPKARS